ncbi:transglutaminase family protein [Flavobacteriaceae bacterium XHP0103]|uniref:transglutaminase family protein n=1 Tax=Marixanthotalea marina TaxID=2844359 RepID=UPI00298A0671|nr:transglutaminase family protein [Marixanthotalea marina]MBU3821375.1 transglutaminase family protein [Marixanthotalea marina]
MAKFYIKHLTKYTYSGVVLDAANLVRLHPINDEYQKVISHTIAVTNNAFIQTHTDFYNNTFGTFMLTEPHEELSIESSLEVITYPKPFPDDSASIEKQWKELAVIKKHIDFMDFMVFDKGFAAQKDISKLMASLNVKEKSPYKIVLELCDYVYKNFKYIKGVTTVNSTIDDVWELKSGVCQDFTNILLQLTRTVGIPARYVSGYIFADDNTTRGEGASHAWIEAYIPYYGWLGFDPTNNIIVNENHIRLAIGRNYSDCAPIQGVYKGNVEEELLVNVEVSTTKNKTPNTPSPDFVPGTPNNSYRQNLEIIQHQQHQQQQ